VQALDTGQTNAILTAAEKYLPFLYGLVVSVEENKNLRLNSPLNFTWSSAFGKDNSKPHYITCYTYRFEAVMVTLTFAIANINKAFEVVNSGGNTAESFEEPSKRAALLLRTAAGVFDYIATRELPRWIDAPKDRPFEVNIGVCKALSEYCCATAQTVTLKKALFGESTSKQVMAKLAVDVWKKYDSVHDNLKLFPEYKEVNPIFKNFLSLAQSLSKATAYKYMGESAHKDEKFGHAVSYLNVAANCLKTVWVPSPNTPLAKFRDEIERAKEYIEHIKRSIANENNHIYFQKEVEEAALELFEAKCLMTALGWMPPKPAFENLV